MNEKFWDEKYRKVRLGWDIGYISTPLKEYIGQLKRKNLRILIPGGGNSYEAEFLYLNGFSNAHVIDISVIPLDNLRKRVPQFPNDQLHHGDFFDFMPSEKFDLIIEQTFFCALQPSLRVDYAKKMHDLLKPTGTLIGLLFNINFESGPPYGGEEAEYRKLFEPFFEIAILEEAYNSIPERQGNELFIKLIPKTNIG